MKFRKLLSEFKDFAAKGDAISLAIGLVIGTAFKGVIDSLVNDIIMPPITFLTSRVDFTNLFIVLGRGHYTTYEQAKTAGAVVIHYGNFINQLVIFLITAIAIFITIFQFQKLMNQRTKVEEKKQKEANKCKYCLMEIPDGAKKCGHCGSNLK